MQKKNTANAPQIVKKQNASNDAANAASRARSGKECPQIDSGKAGFPVWSNQTCNWMIEKFACDPNGITRQPSTLRFEQLRTLRIVAGTIRGGRMTLTDCCTTDNAPWIFAVVDRVAAEFDRRLTGRDYWACVEPSYIYAFLLSLRFGLAAFRSPSHLYRAIYAKLDEIAATSPGVLEAVASAAALREDATPGSDPALVIQQLRRNAVLVAVDALRSCDMLNVI